MMRLNLALACFVSLALIGGAVLYRTIGANDQYLALESVKNEQFLEVYEGDPEEMEWEDTTSTSNESELNQTDLISRQLFTDFIGLATRGESSTDNINALAETYASGIAKLEVAAHINRSEIVIIPDSDAALLSYGSVVISLRNRYVALMSSKSLSGEFDLSSPDFGEFMNFVADLYDQASEELKKLPVPESLADNHVKLINNYLSSAQASRSLANVSSDPLGAYSAINTQAQNSNEESALLIYIQTILAVKGLTPNSL